MAKYVIEIEDVPFGRNDDPVIPHGMDELYRAKGFKSLVFDQNGLDKLTPYTEPDEQSVEKNAVNLCTSCKLFKEHFPECGDVNVLFGDGVGNDNICCCSGYVAKNEDEIRQKVEDEVWDFARRIICPSDCCEDSISKYTEKFLGIPSHKARAIFKDLSYQEAKAKYESWEKQKDEIRVGDEIKQITANGSPNGLKCTVIEIDGDKMHGIGEDGNIVVCSFQVKRWWRKTGRHFDEVTELLKKMKETDEIL